MDQHAMNDDGINPQAGPYFYQSDQDPAYQMGYNAYPASMHPSARAQIVQDIQHPSYHTLNTLGLQHHQQQQHQYQQQQQAGVFSTSPPHGSLPSANSPPPPSPDLYDPLSPPLSGSDTSADALYHHSNSSGANSPSSSRGHSLAHRSHGSHRYNPTPSPTSSSGRRRSRSNDSDDDDVMGIQYVENLASSRKEATRRQRIEAEQRRRDELREGYAKLKEALPVSNQKSSKVSLLERATNYIITLEQDKKELLEKLAQVEAEAKRLRMLNEKISLSTEGTPSPEHNSMGRTMSPSTPDATGGNGAAGMGAGLAHQQQAHGHSLASVRGQQPPSEHSSPSASEGGH